MWLAFVTLAMPNGRGSSICGNRYTCGLFGEHCRQIFVYLAVFSIFNWPIPRICMQVHSDSLVAQVAELCTDNDTSHLNYSVVLG